MGSKNESWVILFVFMQLTRKLSRSTSIEFFASSRHQGNIRHNIEHCANVNRNLNFALSHQQARGRRHLLSEAVELAGWVGGAMLFQSVGTSTLGADAHLCLPLTTRSLFHKAHSKTYYVSFVMMAVLWVSVIHMGIDITLQGMHRFWADESLPQACLQDNEHIFKLRHSPHKGAAHQWLHSSWGAERTAFIYSKFCELTAPWNVVATSAHHPCLLMYVAHEGPMEHRHLQGPLPLCAQTAGRAGQQQPASSRAERLHRGQPSPHLCSSVRRAGLLCGRSVPVAHAGVHSKICPMRQPEARSGLTFNDLV
eukprot:1142302-Pelagomonas_calceolata.AAC.1